MDSSGQYPLPLIDHDVKGEIIRQRSRDGYINATAMCKAAGRRWKDYRALSTTKPFLDALEASTATPSSELIQTLTGGHPHLQGTWVHPQVAVHLGQWLSPEFAVQVTEWVFDWLSGKAAKPDVIPDFVRRFHLNSDRVAPGHFSVIGELFIRMYGRLEKLGYQIPNTAPDGKLLRPDNSVGKRFSAWLSENHPELDGRHSFYKHAFPNGFEFEVRQYPNIIWPYFVQFVDEVWIPENAATYFKTRDPAALEYIPKLLPPPT